MKKLLILVLMALIIPASAMAMKGMEHDSKKMDHGSMGMDGVVLLQDEVVDGVKASAHLMDMKGGGQMIMVMFTEAEGGKMITKGRVAVKIESPDEKIGDPKKMKKSKGMFGTGVKFDQKGMYHFKVGTKLADGEKRTFHFHHEN
jgi:hypothetical protein